MRGNRPLFFLATFLVTVGWGCAATPYTPAPSITPVEVTPTPEGARASTGGESATITQNLSTELLVAALPSQGNGWQGGDVAELRNPIPLPDGSRAEYVGVTREYTDGQGQSIRVTITDTRGIPALTAFLDGYDARQDAAAYRSHILVGGQQGWMTYTYGTNGEADGTGSLVLLFRDRFLAQLDGSVGVSAESIAHMAERIAVQKFQ